MPRSTAALTDQTCELVERLKGLGLVKSGTDVRAAGEIIFNNMNMMFIEFVKHEAMPLAGAACRHPPAEQGAGRRDRRRLTLQEAEALSEHSRPINRPAMLGDALHPDWTGGAPSNRLEGERPLRFVHRLADIGTPLASLDQRLQAAVDVGGPAVRADVKTLVFGD